MNKAVKGAIRSLSINEPPIFYPTLQVFKDNLSKADACCNKILIELLLDKDKYAWWNAEVVKVGTELWKGTLLKVRTVWIPNLKISISFFCWCEGSGCKNCRSRTNV